MFLKKLFYMLIFSTSFFSQPISANPYEKLIQDVMSLIQGDSKHLFKVHMQAVESSKSHSLALGNIMDKCELTQLHLYTVADHLFNEPLKKGQSISSPTAERALSLYNIMQKSPKSKNVVFRGLRSPPNIFGVKIEPDDFVKTNIFTSSSFSPKVAKEYADRKPFGDQSYEKVFLIFDTKYSMSISSYAKENFIREAEAIIPVGTIFQVKEMEFDGTYIYVILADVDDIPPNSIIKDMYNGEVV